MSEESEQVVSVPISSRYGPIHVRASQDLISDSIRLYGEWAQREIDVLLAFLQPGDVVVDAGAYVGTHSRAFSERVGAEGGVVAFEPNPSSFAILEQNARLAPLHNIRVMNLGLGDQPEMRRIEVDDRLHNQASAAMSQVTGVDPATIRVERLDDVDIPQVDLLKVDVEGMELQLLAGAERTITRDRPVIFLEVNALEGSHRFLDWARQHGYVGYGVNAPAFNPENFAGAESNIFGSAREVGLLLVHVESVSRFTDALEQFNLPLVDSLDGLAMLLLHKPQYLDETLVRTDVGKRLGEGLVTSDARQFEELKSLVDAKNTALEDAANAYTALRTAFDQKESELRRALQALREASNAPIRILVTGGAGFIGSALIRHLLQTTGHEVLNLDKLTYAGNLESLATVQDHPRYQFVQADIADGEAVRKVFTDFQPDMVVHLAAESHVDRSIAGPAAFIQSNIVGTYALLEATRAYWAKLSDQGKLTFRFHHISTDEVYGDQLRGERLITEAIAYAPSSPYAASKAAADHLVRAWQRTYGVPVLITTCSNNYGPFQFPEKLIPLTILNAIEGKPLPVYGDGGHVRDWLFVEDHARALLKVVSEGRVGETYNIGGDSQQKNIDVVRAICGVLEEMAPDKPPGVMRYEDLITFVEDRPGHDQRYAIDASKIKRDLGWAPQETFITGLRKTVQWYLDNLEWCRRVRDGSYRGDRPRVPA